jgi:hypothetical protein
MALVNLSGNSLPWFSGTQFLLTAQAFSTTAVIDATGEKVAFCGRVFFQGRSGTKDIERVGFRFGAVTKSGGSGLTVSLQNVSAAAGQPMQPDETQDQTVAIANADASFVANTWIRTGTLSANRTVALGELVAVVIEYDGSGRLSSDTVAIAGLVTQSSGPAHGASTSLKAGTWGVQSILPNVILEFSDGSFGTLQGGFPCSAVGSQAYNSGTAISDEYALEMTFPGPVGIDGASSDAEMILYDGTTPLATIAMDGMHTPATSARVATGQTDAVVELQASTTYRLALKPTSANNVTLWYFDVAVAGHLQAHVGGVDWCLTTRVDSGAWAAATTTRRPFLWPNVCAIDDGAGAGGGGPLIGAGRLVR